MIKRSFLQALGLEKEQVDQIMAEVGTAVETEKTKAQEAAQEEIKRYKDKAADLETRLKETAKGDKTAELEQLQSELQSATEKLTQKETELTEFKTSVESDKVKALKDAKLTDALVNAGANSKFVKLLKTSFDLDTIELDGDNIKGFDELLAPVKETYADVFKVAEIEGTPPQTPPTGASPKLTRADIEKMTPKEINTRWDEVQKVISNN